MLILAILFTTGYSQERVANDAGLLGRYAPAQVQQDHPLAPMQVVKKNASFNANTTQVCSVSNVITPKVARTAPKSLPGGVQPLAPMQGGDLISNAFVLTGSLPISTSGTTAGYTDNYNSVCPYTATGGRDVVYSYTPSSNLAVDIDLCGSSYDTKVYVFESDGVTVVACNDDYYTDEVCGEYVSFISGASLLGGNTYYIVVDGYSSTDFGAYQMVISENVPCVWGVDVIPPSGAVAESEACGDDTNGGCNMDAGFETWEPVPSSGGAIYGTTWADAGNRDTDWFELVLTSASSVVITADADQTIIYGYITGTFPQGSPDCATVSSISPNNLAGGCNQTSIDMGVLPAGTYWFFV